MKRNCLGLGNGDGDSIDLVSPGQRPSFTEFCSQPRVNNNPHTQIRSLQRWKREQPVPSQWSETTVAQVFAEYQRCQILNRVRLYFSQLPLDDSEQQEEVTQRPPQRAGRDGQRR